MSRRELPGFGTAGPLGGACDEPLSGTGRSCCLIRTADWRDLARPGGFPVPALHLDDAQG